MLEISTFLHEMSDDNDSMEETSNSFFFLNDCVKSVKNDIKNIDYSQLPKYNNKPLNKIRNDIIQMINSKSEEELMNSDDSSTPLNKFFQDIYSQVFDEEILHQVLYTFPICLPMSHQSKIDKKDIKNLTLFLISIIQDANEPLKALHYIISHFLYQRWHKNKSATTDAVKNFCLCRNKKDGPLVASNNKGKTKTKNSDNIDPKNYTDFTWVIADRKKKLYIYKITNGVFNASNQVQQPYSEMQSENGMIKVIYQGSVVQKLYPVSKDQMSAFLSQIDFPNLIYSMPKHVPNEIFNALYQAITSDDLLVVRAVAHYSVTKVLSGMPLCEALMKIFSYANKTHALLSALVGMEFENPSLTTEQILRTNSHLTNTFKIINRKYGKLYFEKIINPLRKYILKKGDIGLKDTAHANEKEAKIMFFTVFKYIFASSKFVSPQMRHVIYLLRTFSGIRFNNYESTYNAISGYFFLRFFSSLFIDPSALDPNTIIDDDTNSNIILPFIQLIQTSLNLKPLHGRMERFSNWNQAIEKNIFPKLIPFAFSLAEIEEVPTYEPPSKEEVKKALEDVLNIISENHDKFQKRYTQLKCIKTENYPPVGWCFGSFLCEFFKNYGEIEH